MIPQFANSTDKLAWLRQNKHLLLQAKKSAVKHADAISGVNIATDTAKASDVAKELGIAAPPANGILSVKSVINTTGLMDSHMDVHVPGIWKKSLSEQKMLYHLQEHKMQFDKVITDEVTAYTKSLSWKSLGFDYAGNTQALVFDSIIKADRNPYMFEQYSKGYVKNHSVGMRYVKIFMCVNSEEKYWAEEKANWDKYYPDVVNQDVADEQGMFWAVTEAQIVEGSAVLVGSNGATPTLEVSEAGKATPEIIEPEPSTQPRKSVFASIGDKINN